MLVVETHCHTNASGDCQLPPEDLLAACRARSIDRVIITDHNTIAGALAAQRLEPERVIVGEEILTTKGELLAAFVTEEVSRLLEPLETIQRLRDQGAFISVSHPFDPYRSGWSVEDLEELAPLVDAIEIFNARNMLSVYNRRAKEFAQKHGLLGTVGSDAHTAFELGRAVMQLPAFSDAASFRLALKEGQVRTRASSPLVRLASRLAVLRRKRTHRA